MNEELNQKIHEWLGKCWHENVRRVRRVDEKSFRKALAESEIETSSQMVN